MKRLSAIAILVILLLCLTTACGREGPAGPPDVTPPTVILTSPINGAQNVAINSAITITFSEAMDASTINEQTITLSAGTGTISGSVTYSDTTAVYEPASSLNPGTIYTVTVDGGVKDVAGNIMVTPFSFIFFTGNDVQQDNTPPRVIDVQPSNRKTDVSANTVIVLMFSEPMDPSTITNTTIKISTVAGDWDSTVTPFGSAAIIKPTLDLAPSTDFTVLVTTRVKDLAGNAVTDAFVSNYRTGTVNDTNAPSVVTGSVIPAPGSTTISVNTPISVTFSKPMNVSTITPSTFIVNDGTSTIPGDIQYYGTKVVFTPSTPLQSSTVYTVTIKNLVTDLSGNKMSADYSWSFTTEPQASDSIPPLVLSTYPTSNQTNVPVYRNVVVLFNETMLVSSITSTTFSLADSLGTLVPGTITASGAVVIFTPVQPLAYNTTYTATMTTAATDIAGNPFTTNYTWRFTTEVVASFTITPSAGPQGSINPSTAQIVSYGSATTFTITPVAGYHIADVLVDGSTVGPVASYTFTAVTTDHTISASFAINTYTIAASVSSGTGTISPANATVNYGANQTFTITPGNGYQITDVLVDGGSIGVQTSYTFTIVTTNHTISASFAINKYTITATAGANGSISPASQLVSYNTTTTFTVTPSANYYAIMGGTCGGTLVGNTYTTSPVTANCTVTANFAINTYTIATSVSSGTGTISPVNPAVNYNANQTFTITPGTGYHVADVLVDGVSVGAVTTYTFNNVITVHTISASFAINTNTITASAGANGSISPSGAVSVNYGANQTFTFTPNTSAYFVSAVLVDGVDQGLISSYTFNNVTAPHTIAVSFAIWTYTITASAGSGGTIAPTGTVLVSSGGHPTFTITPNSGYHIADVLVDGFSIGAQTSYTFPPLTANHTISASFAINTYTINFVSGGNGTLTGTTSQTVSYGGSATAVTAVPSTGYHFVNWTGTGGFVTTTSNPLTVTNVTAAQTITANFAINTFAINFVSGGNGTLTGTTSQTVSYGGSATAVTAVPSTGYHFVNWTGTGGFVTTTSNPLTVTNVTAAQTITANFAINTFAINFVSGGNGTLTGTTSQTVSYGGSATAVTAVPSTGYHFVNWTGTGGFVTTTSNPLTVTNVTAAQTITANFAINTFAINFVSGGNGTLTGTTSQTVSYGGSATAVTAVPSTGYHFVNWTGTGGFVTTTSNPLTVTNVTAAQTITANFAINTFAINFVSGGNGTLTGTTSQTVSYGGSATAVTAVPSTGYHFVNWTGTGGFVTTTSNPLTVTNVTAPQTITANFAINTFTVTPSVVGSGNINPNAPQTVAYGSTISFTLSPSANIVSVTGCNGSLLIDTYTTDLITADCAVIATFSP